MYLSPDDLLASSSARSNGNRSTPEAAWSASLSPLLTGHSEVVVLIDRGGAGGDQTFAAAAATAAGAVASVVLSPRQEFLGGLDGDRGGGGRCCRCVGVIIVNDRPGHEVFPMATDGEKKVRAPYPVVMVSQESGQLLKGSLAQTSFSPSANSAAVAGTTLQLGVGWGAPARLAEQHLSRLPHYLGGNNAGWGSGSGGGGGGGGGGVIVSLGAAQHCPARAAPAEATGAYSCSTSSPATSMSSAVSYGEEGDGDFEASRFTTAVSAGDGFGWAPPVFGYPFPHASSGYEVSSSIGVPLSCYSYNSNAVAAEEELRSRAGNFAEAGSSSRGAGRDEGDVETGEWKREEMLYHAKTLPVRFTKSIW